jgi:hypothetical protein
MKKTLTFMALICLTACLSCKKSASKEAVTPKTEALSISVTIPTTSNYSLKYSELVGGTTNTMVRLDVNGVKQSTTYNYTIPQGNFLNLSWQFNNVKPNDKYDITVKLESKVIYTTSNSGSFGYNVQ